MSDPWLPDTERYGDPDQAQRWDEADRQQDAEHARIDRLRDRAGDSVCSACGSRYINYGAHMERCYGRTTARAALAPQEDAP